MLSNLSVGSKISFSWQSDDFTGEISEIVTTDCLDEDGDPIQKYIIGSPVRSDGEPFATLHLYDGDEDEWGVKKAV